MQKYINKFFIYLLITSFSFLSTEVVSEQHKSIYVYVDDGVSLESLHHTLTTFSQLLKNYHIKTINAKQVKEGKWREDAILFVMPGGADLPYVMKLQGEGNRQIQEYVQNGGSYLGLCAGAYFASSFVEFDKNGPLEVIGNRELKFFNGKSIGPLLATYDYQSQSGARSADIVVNIDGVSNTKVFYNGGGFFDISNDDANVKVIAFYKNVNNLSKNNTEQTLLPCILFINYGGGRVLLSGVHFEYNPYLLDDNDIYLKDITPVLKNHYETNKKLFLKLMHMLNVN